jgi:hypothetical protein
MGEFIDPASLRLKRDQLTAALAHVGDMRPGSLAARFRKCGKPSCHCAKKGSKGHGPSYSLTHAIAGKTVTRVIPAGPAVERTRQQLNEYHRFRELVQQLIAVSEQICDLEVRQAAGSATALKKTSFDELLAAEILYDVEALFGRQTLQALDLEALESALRRQVLGLAAVVVEQRLNNDHSDGGQTHCPCECGQTARYAGRRAKLFHSILGPLTLQRAYYTALPAGTASVRVTGNSGCMRRVCLRP